MSRRRPANTQRVFHVWLVRYFQWQPTKWNDIPPKAVAIELAEPEPMLRQQAANYVMQFNESKLLKPDNCWALAVPITITYRGALRRRQHIHAAMVQKFEDRHLDN